ncbi:DUF2911 domain-containing protein [Chitinophaga lutea]|uniref:DUF2911 domain-containing protein n=1 Tax=Chitinophaga lutea TaxID=2488634 RepID=A0A3N4PL06_9BACT|nr:DUF2911 domain-containing protein [Chitinophaga lutea]RPE08238.1 DUF2911 domain-containing protein [Chitinophaga lutea]
MKKLSAFLSAAALCVIATAPVAAQGIKMPQPSPTQTIKQDFALSEVEVTYSRPAVKGREVLGNLIPYGRMWRVGANAATKIKFGEDVKLNGTVVPAGEYVIYTLAKQGESTWEVVINKGLKNWGTDGYKQEEDVARFKADAQELPFPVESFMIAFENVRPSAMTMMLLWDRVMLPIEITADIDGKVMAQIDAAMKTDKKPYFQAASYYFETGRDLKTALEWADAATKANDKAYWIFHLKAKIQAKMGDKAAAKATAEKSKELAKAGNNADYVLLNEKLIATL